MSKYPKCIHGFGDHKNLNPCPFCTAEAVNAENLRMASLFAAILIDKERLDWLDRHPFSLRTDSDGWTRQIGGGFLECNLREAIDAASDPRTSSARPESK